MLPDTDITREDIYNATAITYPAAYRMNMTGARLKEVLEDVADNLFNPDPYYQQGGDMVRVGGVRYAIDVGKPIGSRISDLTLLRTGKPLDPTQGLHRRRLGERERGHRRPADLGRRQQLHPEEGRRRSARDRPRARHRRLAPPVRGRLWRKPCRGSIPTPAQPRGAGFCAARWRPAAPRRSPRRLHAGNPKNLPPNIPDWTRSLGDGVAVRKYGKPSKHEAGVIRRDVAWLTATPQSSVSFTPLHELDGIITPNGLCFERHHAGIAEVDPADYRLILHGLVDKPLIFTLDDLKRMPRVNRAHFCECAANSGMEWRGAQLNGAQFTHGMVHCVMYTGVPLKTLLDEAGVRPNAKWLLLEGGDASAMSRSLPLQKALDDALVAYRMNGEMLYPENGYPVRMVIPGWEANMWVKWLRRIEVGDEPWHHREETSKYTDLLENGTARRFTFVMDAKSVITNPSPQAPLNHKSGFTVLSGIAWSGRGKIARVDVSLDGGRNWRTAQIDGPAWDKALTRFYYEFDWDGRELLLQSRAMDDSGYVQPSKNELRKHRGVNSIYHNNGIQTWHVHKNGEVENVEVS